MILLLSVVIFAGCKDPGSSSGGGSIGDRETVTAGSASFDMIYVQNQNSVTFPTKMDDSETRTLTTKFFLSETKVTNGVVAEVYQWVYDNTRFNTTNSSAHNYLSTTTARHGGKELLNLDYSYCKINYDGSGHFTVDNGYDDHPVVCISWYGAIMFCNWLTEMRDGNTDNLVYGGITASWTHTDTTEDVTKNGYRLPRNYEWAYAARYRGTDTTNVVTGTINGTDFDAMSTKWTKGNSASDAVDDYNNATATGAVAWYTGNSGNQLHAVGDKRINDLELFDMSGNVWEWCFTELGSFRVFSGGSWGDAANTLRVGNPLSAGPQNESGTIGFRLCRTK